MTRSSRRIAAIVSLGAIVGLVLGVLVVADGPNEDSVRSTVGPELGPDVVVTRWSDLRVSPDRRSVSLTAADPVVGACTRPLGINLEVREQLVVVRPVFELQPNVACEQACDVIPLSIELADSLPADVTFVAGPEAVATCDEGIQLDQ